MPGGPFSALERTATPPSGSRARLGLDLPPNKGKVWVLPHPHLCTEDTKGAPWARAPVVLNRGLVHCPLQTDGGLDPQGLHYLQGWEPAKLSISAWYNVQATRTLENCGFQVILQHVSVAPR